MLEDFKEEQQEFYDYALKIVNNNKISHAYFIETSTYNKGQLLAKAFAKFLILENLKTNKKELEINEINKLIDNNLYKDLYIINPDGQNIKKEQIIDLKDEFSNKSLENNLRVYIINDADKLNKSSANSMLKFLEEPEDNIVAILVAENRYNVIKTILSRCQCLKLKSNINVDLKDNEIINNMMDFIMNIERNGLKSICYIKKLWNDKYTLKEQFVYNFDVMIKIYMDIINYKLNKNINYNIFESDYNFITKNNDINNLLEKINIINEVKNNLKFNLNSGLLMDKLIIDLVGGRKND